MWWFLASLRVCRCSRSHSSSRVVFKFLISCRRCLARVLTLYINTALLVPLSVSINNMLCVFRPAQRGTATLHLSTTTTSPNRPARRSMKSSVTASQTEGPCRKETSSTVRASVLSDAPKQAQLWSSSQTRNCFSFWNVKVKSLEVSCCYFINESWRGIWFPSGEYWWQRSETVSAGVWPILAGFYECVYCDVHRSPRSLW